MSENQLQAERSHVLSNLVSELGGLAHEYMETSELDTVVDNMLSKGVPHAPSNDMLRWIHTHRRKPGFKIAQILGAHVSNASSIVPECLGKFFDKQAVECGVCLDRTLCQMRMKQRAAADGNISLVQIDTKYPLGKAPTSDNILQVLSQKWGQISKTLSRGDKVVLEVVGTSIKVRATGTANLNTEEDTTMAKKGAVAVEEEEELDLNLDLSGEEEEEVEVEEEEEEAVAATPAPKAGKKGAATAAPAAAAAPAADAKPKKEPKPKAVLNAAQQQFQAELDKRSGDDKAKYSDAVAKKLKVTVEQKGDARIDHMLRVMAIKKHLAAVGKKA